jgi:hypothetical protein
MPSLIPKCLDLAKRVRFDRVDAVKRLARASTAQRGELLAHVESAMRALPARKPHRKLLALLASALREAESLHEMNEEALTREAKRSALERESRRKLQSLVAKHPNGAVIAGTQVQGYRSPSSDIRWASKRKRRP